MNTYHHTTTCMCRRSRTSLRIYTITEGSIEVSAILDTSTSLSKAIFSLEVGPCPSQSPQELVILKAKETLAYQF